MIEDNSGTISAVWFNQSYLSKQLKIGQEVFLSGKVKTAYGVNEINVTDYEIMDGEDSDISIVPVYSLTEGLNQKVMRKLVFFVLNNYLQFYPDILNEKIIKRYNLCDIQSAINNIHFPASGEAYLLARRRLAFEELLLFKLSLNQEKASLRSNRIPVSHQPKTNLVAQITNNLVFNLTDAQKNVLEEILRDMAAFRPMNRLLQGDVGCGKTIIAALAMAQAVASGYQADIMVPTEILAEQHYSSIRKYFNKTEIIIACLTGGTSAGERRMILETAASGVVVASAVSVVGEGDVAVGTAGSMALIAEQDESSSASKTSNDSG
jgi:ATP-dependent DNA helicase RecG